MSNTLAVMPQLRVVDAPQPTYQDQPAIPRGGLIVISGDSGVGKTHLIRQCLLDPDWGPERVLVFYAENPMATIGEDTGAKHFRRVKTMEGFVAEIESLAEETGSASLQRHLPVHP